MAEAIKGVAELFLLIGNVADGVHAGSYLDGGVSLF
jgi:hypothetical protein